MAAELPTPKSPLHEAAMLQWINDFAPYGVVTTDTAFRIQSWNRWMTTHSDLAFSEVANRSLFDIFPEIKQRGLGSRFDRALTGEVSVLSTALHGYLIPMQPAVRASGFDQMQQTARIAPLVFDGKTVGTIIVVDDVTQREAQALLLRHQHERDALLSWALAHLLEAQEPRRSVRDLFCRVAEQSDFDGYLLFLLDESSNLKLQTYGGILPEVGDQVSVLAPATPLFKALASAKSAQACEHLDAPHSKSVETIFYEQFGFKVCVLLPLETPEGIMGVLCLGARNRSDLKEGELDLLSTIGKYLAVSLHKEGTNVELLRAQSKLNQHALELERQVSERTATLRDIISELETFSYSLAHDLRAPIRALIGYSEAVLEDHSHLLPADGIDLLNRLRRSCQQLDRLTRDLLEFSKVSRQDIQVETVDLADVISAVVALLPDAAETVRVKKPLHAVRAHRGLLQQCVSNLVDNALKFVKEGEAPKITIWTELIGGEAPVSGQPLHPPFNPARKKQPNKVAGASGRVRIVVEDQGIGVTPGAHAKIFGIFERGTSSQRFSGSGIGLAIVARAVQKMGGACGVESELGLGSRFWLEFPAA